MSLIKNNAKVAAQIAVALSSIFNDCNDAGAADGGNAETTRRDSDGKIENKAKPVVGNCNKVATTPLVIGGSILDVHYRVRDNELKVSLQCLDQQKS